MKTANTIDADARLVSESGRRYVPVVWDAAENLRSALRRLGYPSTLCLNPEAREARLELWPDVNPAEFLAALEQLRATPVPPLNRPTPAANGTAAEQLGTVPAAQRT
jgi:hypothetical protein